VIYFYTNHTYINVKILNPLHSRGDSRSPHDLMPQLERWLSFTTWL